MGFKIQNKWRNTTENPKADTVRKKKNQKRINNFIGS